MTGAYPMSEFLKILACCDQRVKHHSEDHVPHPADQGIHFEQIHGFLPVTAKQEPERATRRRARHGVPGGRIEEKPPERRAQARTRSRSSVFALSHTNSLLSLPDSGNIATNTIFQML